MKILRIAAVVALLASLSAPVVAAEAARQTAIPDKPAKSDALVTPINVELEGTDSIGARLGMRLKERFNQSNLFRLMEANERKMAKTFNMIVLGGLLKIRPVVSIESVVKALRKTLPERHHHLIPMNEEAIKIGMDIIKPV